MAKRRELVSEARRKQLATNIRKRRRWLDITQAELARALKTKQQQITLFEKGDAVPDIFQAEIIADTLDTTIDWLLDVELNGD